MIRSGGTASVYGDGAPTVGKRVFDLGVPILGICYGAQSSRRICSSGKSSARTHAQYGAAKVKVTKARGMLHRFAEGESLDVWMSHGDRIAAMPAGFETLGLSDNTPFCAVGDDARRIYGVQFHPEVVYAPRGAEISLAFLFDVAEDRAVR